MNSLQNIDQQKYQAIFQLAALGIARVSPEGKWLELNNKICEIVGYSKEELSQLTFQDITHPDDLDLDLSYVQSMLKKEIDHYSMEKRYIKKDGQIVWINLSVTLVLKDDGSPDYFISIIEDITESRKNQEQLVESERRFHAIFDTVRDGIVVANQASKQIIEVNPAISKMIGYTQDELVGMTVEDIHPKERLTDILEQFDRQARGEIAIAADTPVQRKDGSIFYADISTASLNLNEQPCLLGLFRDTTEQKEAEQQLANTEVEWVQAMDQFDDAIYIIDLNRQLVRANQTFYRMIHSDPEHCIGMDIDKLVHTRGEAGDCPICQSLRDKKEGNFILEADDSHNLSGRPLEVRIKHVQNVSGEISGMLVSMHDLSHSRKTAERLKLMASIFDNTSEAILVTDANANIIEINQSFIDITGCSREEVIGQNPRIWKSGRHDVSFYQNMWHSLSKTGKWRGEIWNRRKNGEIFPVWQNISSIHDQSGQLIHYISIFSDISQVKQAQRQLDHLSQHDALTDLPNRTLLNERLERSINHSQRLGSQLAIIFIDLDGFKFINDSFGYQAGDTLLRGIAEMLMSSIRQDDTVARISSDEFVLLLEDVNELRDIIQIAEKLLIKTKEPIALNNQDITVTASLGICLYPQDGKSAAELLKNANAAMYKAKEDGGDNFQFYSTELTQSVFERVLLESNLHQALKQNEFVLYYQPQFNLETGQVVGVEALIRWQQPQLGQISPDRFIPLAEDSGLIIPIGNWVLHEACRQAKTWLDQGFDFGRIAVNVSGLQIQRGGVAEKVIDALKASELPASFLELEVTEGFIMKNSDKAIQQLEALRQVGVVIAIDDFGTGYSSLSYLKKLPIDKLKIDQSFVHDIPNDTDDMAICAAIVALGKNLGMTVIAEGVEKEEQAKSLQKIGCDEVQGFLYSKPISANKFENDFYTHSKANPS